MQNNLRTIEKDIKELMSTAQEYGSGLVATRVINALRKYGSKFTNEDSKIEFYNAFKKEFSSLLKYNNSICHNPPIPLAVLLEQALCYVTKNMKEVNEDRPFISMQYKDNTGGAYITLKEFYDIKSEAISLVSNPKVIEKIRNLTYYHNLMSDQEIIIKAIQNEDKGFFSSFFNKNNLEKELFKYVQKISKLNDNEYHFNFSNFSYGNSPQKQKPKQNENIKQENIQQSKLMRCKSTTNLNGQALNNANMYK